MLCISYLSILSLLFPRPVCRAILLQRLSRERKIQWEDFWPLTEGPWVTDNIGDTHLILRQTVRLAGGGAGSAESPQGQKASPQADSLTQKAAARVKEEEKLQRKDWNKYKKNSLVFVMFFCLHESRHLCCFALSHGHYPYISCMYVATESRRKERGDKAGMEIMHCRRLVIALRVSEPPDPAGVYTAVALWGHPAHKLLITY